MELDILEGFDLSWGLKRILKERQMTQGDIMRATGLERANISRMVTGKVKDIRVRMAIRLAHALGMTCDEFVAYCNRNGK